MGKSATQRWAQMVLKSVRRTLARRARRVPDQMVISGNHGHPRAQHRASGLQRLRLERSVNDLCEQGVRGWSRKNTLGRDPPRCQAVSERRSESAASRPVPAAHTEGCQPGETSQVIHVTDGEPARQASSVDGAPCRLGAFPLTSSRPRSARNRPVLCFLTPISASGRAASGSAAGRTGIRNPAVLARGVSTPVDTARHGEIRGPGPDRCRIS